MVGCKGFQVVVSGKVRIIHFETDEWLVSSPTWIHVIAEDSLVQKESSCWDGVKSQINESLYNTIASMKLVYETYIYLYHKKESTIYGPV